MLNPVLKAFIKKVYHYLRRKSATLRALAKFRKPRARVLFIFPGLNKFNAGTGCDLYKSEPAFRDSIRRSDGIVQLRTGGNLISNFEGSVATPLFDDGGDRFLLTVFVQIALVDLWRAKGIQPDAVLGISLGEITAGYAAGAFSQEETIDTALKLMDIILPEKREFVGVFIKTKISHAQHLLVDSPIWAACILEITSQTTLAITHSKDVQSLQTYLSAVDVETELPQSKLFRPHHTSLVHPHIEAFSEFSEQINISPLQCDYYSSSLSRLIKKNALLEANHCFTMVTTPVLMDRTIKIASEAEFDVAIHITPFSLFKHWVEGCFPETPAKPVFFDSVHSEIPEMETLQSNLKKLKKKKATKSYRELSEIETYENFKTTLHLNEIQHEGNPFSATNYLRQYGSVHYLHQHKAWLLLDHKDINYVFQTPDIFSSEILNDFDRFLLGADLPDHTAMRAVLQPFFSPKVSGLELFIQEKVEALIEKVANSTSFNFVEEFSIPLVRAVTNRFLGLKDEESRQLEQSLTGHAYNLLYLKDLEIFFSQHLTQLQLLPAREGMGTTLLNLVRKNELPFEGAVSLMKLIWIAGTSTSSIVLSNSVNILLRTPHLREKLQDDDQLFPKFIEESLRVEPPELQLLRIVKKPVTLGGQQINPGELVILSVAAANRDRQVFFDPDNIRLDRSANKHYTFGGGFHHCIGVAIARMEIKIALQIVMKNLPGLRLIEPQARSVYFPSHHFRALAELMVTNRK